MQLLGGKTIMSKIVSRKYAVMLLHSDLLNNPDYLQYRAYIQDGTELEKIPKEDVDLIKDQRANWIRISMSEWRADKKKPVLTVKRDYHGVAQHCDLCNAKLDKSVYHVRNTKNDEELYIGDTCLDHVLNQEPGMSIAMTPEQFRRQVQFKKQYPSIMRFLGEAPSNQAPFEVSSSIIKNEAKLRRDANTLMRKFRNDKKEYGKIIQLERAVEGLPAKISRNMQNKNEANSLSLDFRIQLEADQKGELKRIRSITQKNDGFLNTEAAQLILDPGFCERYLSDLVQRNVVDETGIAKMEFIKRGSYRVYFISGAHKVAFIAKTGTVISTFSYPVVQPTRRLSNELLRSKIHLDAEHSIGEVLNIGREALASQDYYEVTIQNQEFKEYIAVKEKDLPENDKTKFSISKYKRIQRNNIIFQIENRFCVLSPSELMTIGRNLFVSTFSGESYSLPTITTMSKVDVLDSLRIAYDASGSSKY